MRETQKENPQIYIFMFNAVSCFTCLRPITLDAIYFFLLHDHLDLDNFGKAFDGR